MGVWRESGASGGEVSSLGCASVPRVALVWGERGGSAQRGSWMPRAAAPVKAAWWPEGLAISESPALPLLRAS